MRRRTMHQSIRNKSSGFSLVEVLITLVIIAIVAAISAPAILSMAPNLRLKSAARDLYGNLQEAKMLAIKENRDVSVRSIAWGYYIDSDGDLNPDIGEDINCNNILDAGEDKDADGVLDFTEDLNGDGIEDAGEDLDADGFFDSAKEKCVNFADYNLAIKFGNAGVVNDWNGVPWAQANTVTFDNLGLAVITPASSSFYIDYTDSDGVNSTNCYAVETRVAGAVKTYKYNGTIWTD